MGSIWGPFGRESLFYHAPVSDFHSIDCSRARKPASPRGARGRQPNLRRGRRWGTVFSADADQFPLSSSPATALARGTSASGCAHRCVCYFPTAGGLMRQRRQMMGTGARPSRCASLAPALHPSYPSHSRTTVLWGRTSSRIPFLHSRARSTRGF
jgi:hypothetical protein